ncbi:MAG: HK97 gp10 family phage protein [Methanolobus sp.]|uniref:HK97-gp10 family putative phage morphogenesis protein n=1 Tax=Methanolobus sp. TaxID=1874737 RepID=UPI0027300662|nr:HK97-gp10 family putative phage morphogenesis protein [Methanolobus sp.]MDP2217401.1 HK97 gp10 family phage protein [Methanolobus sp.]
MLKVNVEGLKELQQTLKNLGEDITDMMEEATIAGATVVVRAAQENSRKGGDKFPHRITGNLFRSIKVLDKRKKLSRVEVDVGSAMEYALRLEYGFTDTDKLGRRFNQQPRPYLRPALEDNVGEVERAVEKQIGEIVKRYT